jgi:large repetitive protein
MADITAPTLLLTSPSDNATGVSTTSNLTLAFSEAVSVGSGLIKIYQSDGTLFHTIAVNDASQVMLASARVVINPSVTLLAGTSHYVIIESGAFKDLAGNDYAGLSSPTAFNFSTAGGAPPPPPPPADTTAPLLTGTTPADNASDVAVGANLVLTFNEAVKAGSGNVEVHWLSNGWTQTMAITDPSQVTISGNQVILNPTWDLWPGTDYYVLVDSGVVTDLANNPFGGISTWSVFNFSTEYVVDTTAPLLVTTTPADDSTGVAIETNLVLTFNELVKQGSTFGKIQIHDAATGNIVQSFIVADYVSVTFPGTNQVMVNLTPNLLPGKDYYVTIDAGAIVDALGNVFAGISSATVFNFSTPPDATAPLLLSSSPADDATVVPGLGSISLKFSEVVTRGTGYVKIYRAADNSLLESISIEDTFHASFSSYEPYTSGFVNLYLSNTLSSGTAYYVLIDPGAIVDLSGNAFAGISSPTALNFATMVVPDGIAPVLLSTSPVDDSTNVPVDGVITFTFNEAVTVDVGEIRISQQGGTWSTISIQSNDTSQVSIAGGVVTIDPSIDLEPNISYSVQILSNVFADLTGTWFPGTMFNFTTEPTTTPVLLSTLPSDDATNVAVNPVLVLTFDQVVNAGSGNIEIHNANGSIFETIAVTDASRVTIVGNKVIIDPTGTLSQGASYYVTIAPGAIENELGIHSFAGWTDSTTFNFTTKIGADAVAPLLISSSPNDGALDVPQLSLVILTFNEQVVAGSGRIELHRGSDGATVLAGPANALSEYLSFAGNQLTIELGSQFELGESYYLVLDVGAVQDLAGNPFAGIPTPTGLNFTVTSVDTVFPVLMGSGPSDDRTNYPIDGSFLLAFSESVQRGSGNIQLYRSDGTLVANFDVQDQAQVSFGTNTVSIDPSINLDPYTSYYILVDSGAVRDLAGNPWSGISSPTELNFTTGDLVMPPSGGGSGAGAGAGGGGIDTTAPSLTSISPLDNSLNVPTNSNIVLAFNEGVLAGTGTIQIHKVSDGSLVKSIALSDTSQVQFSGATVTVNPSTDLSAGTAYYVVLDSGAVKDGSGNPYAGFSSPAAFNFTTGGSASGLVLTGNGMANTLVGGTGNDVITGLGRGDTLTGGGGADTFVYTAVSDSTGRGYDTITDFNASADLIDLWFQVTGVDTAITSGSLSQWSIDSNLASAVGAAKLGAHHAVLFTPNAGVLSGKTLLIVDANGVAGYQANADLVILLGNASSLAGLTVADFV